MSLHVAKVIKNPLALASAALFIHISAVTAAGSTGDIQQQMKELLTGTTTAHSASQSGPREGTLSGPIVDAQESVRQLLLGTPRFRVAGYEATNHSATVPSDKPAPKRRPVAYNDAQASVRQSMLGQRPASDAS